MRWMAAIVFVFLLFNAALFAQDSQSAITGLVTNSAGAVIQNAAVEAENHATGVRRQTATSSTGNYAFLDLPPGQYKISTSATGFKPIAREEIPASAAQITRIDFTLTDLSAIKDVKDKEPDSEAEEVTEVEAVAPRPENSQWMHNIKGKMLLEVPLLGFTAREGRIRNPLLVLQVTPGSLMTDQEYFRVNGAPSNTESIRIDGQEVNNGFMLSKTAFNQVGVEAVEEFSIMASNYAAEFGQAGGGVINIAMKSGANNFHGSAYEYWANQWLYSNQRYWDSKPRNQRNDFGATLGGPFSLPKKYDGRNKTFFFVNFEQFRQTNNYELTLTVPTTAYRKGDFRKALTGRKLGVDPLNRSIMEGTIYDPATERIRNGKIVRDPFPSNVIPSSRFNAVALKIQKLIPLPTDTDTSQVVDNYAVPWKSPRRNIIGSLKFDQNFSRSKLSFYYGYNSSDSSQALDEGGDGIKTAVTSSKPADSRADTWQINYERTMSATMALRIGAGYQRMQQRQTSGYGVFDQKKELGLAGANFASFPSITGLSAAMGGMKDMGANMQSLSKMEKPSANAGLTWVRKNHIYKIGAELRIEGYPTMVEYPAYGFFNFNANQTGLPSTLGQNLQGGTVGFPYASFLLGLVNNGDIGVVSNPRLGKHSWALFAQDSWKATNKLTFDLGLRYDYQTYLKDTYGRIGSFSPDALNPSAGNLPGALIYEGQGTGRCNCDFAKNYRFAFGPRLGLAYQLSGKITIRAGVGVVYGQTATDNGATLNSGSTNPFYPATFSSAAIKLGDGYPNANPWPSYNAGQTLVGSGISPIAIDRNAGRPPRQIQWSLSIADSITKNISVNIAYIGNRGAWWESSRLVNINALTPERIESFGLDIAESEDQLLLTSAVNSSLASQRGFNKLPYTGFPASQTVAQSLRKFPQYGDIYYRWAPLGRTWYDSVQVKVVKQRSHGLELIAGFSWQKEMAIGNENTGASSSLEAVNNGFDLNSNKHISALSRPWTVYFAPNFTVPEFHGNRITSLIFKDWQITAVLQYASGLPIRVPTSNSNLYSLLFQNTFANRVAGGQLYSKGINGRSLNPTADFALNPSTWKDPDAGEFSTSTAYYNDYRFRRHPSEQISVGRIFRLNDKFKLSVRADVQNIINRVQLADPYYINAGATQVKNTDDVPQSGFGYINAKVAGGNPRNATVAVKIQF